MEISIRKDVGVIVVVAILTLLNMGGMIVEAITIFDPNWDMDTLARFTLFMTTFCALMGILSRMIFRNESSCMECEEGWTKVRNFAVPVLIVSSFSFMLNLSPEFMEVSLSWPLRILSWFIFMLGFVLRAWAQMSLGAEWSEKMRILSDHRVVKDGPYKYVRHPIYVSYIPASVGLLGMTGDLLLGTAAIVYMVASMSRIGPEEKMLSRLDGYREYRNAVPACVPRFRRPK